MGGRERQVSGGERAHAQPHASRGKGWRIGARLRVIVATPLVAVFGFAGLALAGTVGQAQQAGRLEDLVVLAANAGELAYDLQLERAVAADLLATNAPGLLDSYNQQALTTDAATRAYRRQWAVAAPAVPAAARTLLQRVGDQLDRLPQLREQVRFGQQSSVSATAFGYRIIVADLLSYRESVAQAGASAGVADNVRAAAALAQAIESVGQQQVAVVQAVAVGQLTPAMQANIIATRTGFTESSLSFLNLAPADWQAWWEQANTGAAPLAAQQLQDEVARVAPGMPVTVDTTKWIAALTAWTGRLFDVERQVDNVLRAEVQSARQRQVTRAGVEAGATLIALLLAVMVTTVIARQITRRLRRLRDSANEVAFTQLPKVVEDLRAADPTAVRPERVAEQAAPYPQRLSGDEIGELGLAFAHVHRAAVQTAAEQAVMRANVAEIFVHLSRREQRLVDAVLAQVDEVEKDETSPERLESLYKLDNLATRMGRINASLLVLGGVGAGRVRHEDIPLVKVLQAAQSQIEYYQRVRIGMIDDGVALAAECVDELVHLVAELLDNATLYSPPDSDAWMTARALHDRVVIQIGDEGVGLPSQRRDELNTLLARPPAIDVAAVRAMGLTVVGHLAQRYGVRVELRPGPRLGTIAEVSIPPRLTRAIPGVAQMAAAVRSPALDPDPLTGDLPGTGNPPPSWPPNGSRSPQRSRTGPGGASLPTRGAAPVPGNGVPGNGMPGNGVYSNGNGVHGNGTRGNGSAPVHPVSSAPVHPVSPAPRPEYRGDMDDTAQLPIFRQVSGWFQQETGGESPRTDWRTIADEAWQVAERAATVTPTERTSSGLPKRVPQQHLVPGAVELPLEQQPSSDQRDPDRVAAAMAAYARGVAARRPNSADAVTAAD